MLKVDAGPATESNSRGRPAGDAGVPARTKTTMSTEESAFRDLEARIGPLPADLRANLAAFKDSEDRDILREDLPRCQSLEDVKLLESYLQGREAGRLDGLRRAFYVVLGSRDDESAEILEEKAFESSDPEELEELIALAASAIGVTSNN